jgi:hypothetical protein
MNQVQSTPPKISRLMRKPLGKLPLHKNTTGWAVVFRSRLRTAWHRAPVQDNRLIVDHAQRGHRRAIQLIVDGRMCLLGRCLCDRRLW